MQLSEEAINFIKNIRPGELYKILPDDYYFETSIETFGVPEEEYVVYKNDIIMAIRPLTEEECMSCKIKFLRHVGSVRKLDPMYWFLHKNQKIIVESYDHSSLILV